MQSIRMLVFVTLFCAVALPLPALSRQATPVSDLDFGVADALSPLALYDALLATPIPEALLPDDVATMPAYEWRDSNDPDLAGSIGGVIYSDIDPFGSGLPVSITYMVFPDAGGPLAPFALVTKYGETAEMRFDGQVIPAGRADLGGLVAHFVAVDNVLIYGMVPHGEGADEAAEALTEAGLAHLLDVASAAPMATPVAAAAQSAEAAFLAVAAAPYPVDAIPFETGPLVVLPMTISPDESAGGLIGALLVRDADRTYRYPLATFRFYEDEATAQGTIAAAVPSAGTPTPVELPPDAAIQYPTDIIHRNNDTTAVLVQVGSTVVSVETSQGDQEKRRASALELAQIAVNHLEDVTGQPD